MKKILLGLTSLLILCACAHKADIVPTHSLLPIPQGIETAKGSFTVGKGTNLYIAADDNDKSAIANALAAWDMLEATEEK
jgi:hypothetical protein